MTKRDELSILEPIGHLIIHVFEFQVSSFQTGDGINIERKVRGTISRGTLTLRPDFVWMPYCYVNTGATNSTINEAHRLVALLNQVEEKKMEGYCNGQS